MANLWGKKKKRQNSEEYVPGILDGPPSAEPQGQGAVQGSGCLCRGAGLCGSSQAAGGASPLVEQGKREENWAKEVQFTSPVPFKSLFRVF